LPEQLGDPTDLTDPSPATDSPAVEAESAALSD
jgi:hypothetical protein